MKSTNNEIQMSKGEIAAGLVEEWTTRWQRFVW